MLTNEQIKFPLMFHSSRNDCVKSVSDPLRSSFVLTHPENFPEDEYSKNNSHMFQKHYSDHIFISLNPHLPLHTSHRHLLMKLLADASNSGGL